MEWYGTLHNSILAEAIKLPRKADLFPNENAMPVGNFASDFRLFELR
jgi:hypothetical protein